MSGQKFTRKRTRAEAIYQFNPQTFCFTQKCCFRYNAADYVLLMSDSSPVDRKNASATRDSELHQTKERNENNDRETFGSRFLTFWTTIPGILTGLGTATAAIAGLIALFYHPSVDTEYNTPVLNATGDLTTSDGWQFRPFE